jgi:hypothetical protein
MKTMIGEDQASYSVKLEAVKKRIMELQTSPPIAGHSTLLAAFKQYTRFNIQMPESTAFMPHHSALVRLSTKLLDNEISKSTIGRWKSQSRRKKSWKQVQKSAKYRRLFYVKISLPGLRSQHWQPAPRNVPILLLKSATPIKQFQNPQNKKECFENIPTQLKHKIKWLDSDDLMETFAFR